MNASLANSQDPAALGGACVPEPHETPTSEVLDRWVPVEDPASLHKRVQRRIDWVREEILGYYGPESEREIKSESLTVRRWVTWSGRETCLYLYRIVVGRPGDEGTMSSVFCRQDANVFIGCRGGLGRAWSSGPLYLRSCGGSIGPKEKKGPPA